MTRYEVFKTLNLPGWHYSLWLRSRVKEWINELHAEEFASRSRAQFGKNGGPIYDSPVSVQRAILWPRQQEFDSWLMKKFGIA